jgi:hypothetical protein
MKVLFNQVSHNNEDLRFLTMGKHQMMIWKCTPSVSSKAGIGTADMAVHNNKLDTILTIATRVMVNEMQRLIDQCINSSFNETLLLGHQ